MAPSNLGYQKDLFILPFDHRGSFETGLLGPEFSRAGREVTPQELEHLAGYKKVIYEGFLEAVEKDVPAESVAVLVDQKYGEEILADANRRCITTCVTVEKSGQDEFDFEYGDNFRQRIQDAQPVFAKVLVRYNPDGYAELNANQRRRLKVLSDYTHSAGYKFMFELLVPATKAQLESVAQDRHAYDLKARPGLMVKAIKELQEAGIEPDVWKLEGMDEPEAAQKVAAQARSGGRGQVGIIILGRGEDEKRVDHWLTVGAQTRGVIGFAVGRTTFWQPLLDLKEGKTSRAQAVSRIGGNYQRIYQLFIKARAGMTD
jgi:myo-inositol catabolism protein IolC